MDISNPIASQYVANQGLASQLNNQANQLPVKSDRAPFENTYGKANQNATEQAVKPATEDNQNLTSEADRQASLPVQLPQQSANNVSGYPENLAANRYPETPSSQLQPYQNGQLAAQNYNAAQNEEQSSGPIKQYLEVDSMSGAKNTFPRIDFFI